MGTFSKSDQEIQDCLSKRNYTEAEQLIRERLSKEPEQPDGYYFLGVLHYFRGQVAPSIENLKKALSLDPKHTDAAICLSVLLNDVGKYEEAKKTFEQANQSVAHKRIGDPAGIDKKFSLKHLELADLYFRYKRYDEAIEEYTQAIHLDPKSYELKIRLAKAFAKKGFITRAIQELQHLKQFAPTFMPARIQLGLLHYSQGNILDAELEWESVLAIDPTQAESKAYLQMAQRERAKNPAVGCLELV